MPFESVPDGLVALRYPIGDSEQPLLQISDTGPDANVLTGAAMRQGNFLVSLVASSEAHYKPEPKYSPLNDIADTRYLLDYGDEFIGSRSSAQTKSIIARIDREQNDRETLAAGGWYGIVAGVGAGLIDPLNLVPGGAFFKAGRGAKMALSLAGGAAVGTAVQETGLHATQHTRTIEESIWNIGGATILAGLMDVSAGVDRGQLFETVNRLVSEGNIRAASALMADDAMARRDSILVAMSAANLPDHTAAVPFAGTCLTPLLGDGDIVAVDPFADVESGDICMFSIADDHFHYAKLFLGLTDCPHMKAALGQEHEGAAAVFWMANPNSFLTVPLAKLSYVAKVSGRFDALQGFQAFPAWPHDELAADDLEAFADSLQREPLGAFGSPPLVLVHYRV